MLCTFSLNVVFFKFTCLNCSQRLAQHLSNCYPTQLCKDKVIKFEHAVLTYKLYEVFKNTSSVHRFIF